MTTSAWAEGEVQTRFSGCRNLREVIAHIESDFASRGEVVCEIRVNGMVLSESDEARFAESDLGEIKDLSVRSQKPSTLIDEAISSALAVLDQLERACLDTSERLRGTDLTVARKRFSEVVEGCQWLVDTLVHIRTAGSGLGIVPQDANQWTQADQALGRVVADLSAAFIKSDFVLVADLLEYELTTSCAAWREILRAEVSKRSSREIR